MRQISLPLLFSDYYLFYIEKLFSIHTQIMLEQSETLESLIENDNSTSDSAVKTEPTAAMIGISIS